MCGTSVADAKIGREYSLQIKFETLTRVCMPERCQSNWIFWDKLALRCRSDSPNPRAQTKSTNERLQQYGLRRDHFVPDNVNVLRLRMLALNCWISDLTSGLEPPQEQISGNTAKATYRVTPCSLVAYPRRPDSLFDHTVYKFYVAFCCIIDVKHGSINSPLPGWELT